MVAILGSINKDYYTLLQYY